MELRVLQYFLAITREQSITAAAESLHLSQPTLSRQIHDMEEELGKQLFIRTNKKIQLTEEGMILRKHAEAIMALVHKAEEEISLSDDVIAGDVTIGAAETDIVKYIVDGAKAVQEDYPDIHFHINSGDRITVLEDLDRGLIDFALVFDQNDDEKYESLSLPGSDTFGVLMRKDSELAIKEKLSAKDLWGKPLIVSRQGYETTGITSLLNIPKEHFNVVATYNLLYNGSLMAEKGMGYVLGFNNIINVSGDSPLCFRPLAKSPELKARLVWKKYQLLSKAAEQFLIQMQNISE